MGDQKFQRKKYSTPRHPWEKERIEEERRIVLDYGLRSKHELWRSEYFLEAVRVQARNLQARLRYKDPNAENQFERLISRLSRYNILSKDATLDDVLSLKIEDILERRLQTIVYRKNLASTVKQARQLVTHGHIAIKGKRVDIPGYMVKDEEEDHITYYETSPLADELHPIRQVISGGAPTGDEDAGETPENQEKGSEPE